MNYDLFYQKKGGTPSKVESWSHYNDPIPKDGQPHGNSRRHGDASLEVQAQVIDTLVAECHKRGFTREDTAHVLAIARIESGFNPDAAAGESSASGIGQFIDKTGAGYGLKNPNRFDLQDNVRALVDHFEDNKNLAHSKGKDVAHVYKYHHDGPVNNSGGLSLAKTDVLPHARAYANSELLKDFKSSPAALGTGARIDSEFKRERPAPDHGRGHSFDMPALKGPDTGPKLEFDLQSFAADFRKQLQRVTSEFHKEEQPGAGRPASGGSTAPNPDNPRMTELNSTDNRASASAISLSLALREHLIEKGFDADTVSKAQTLADTIKGLDSREAASSYLVIHKEGAAVAALVPKSEQIPGLHAGDSVLIAERVKALSANGLDVDAVATLRGLAPEKTQVHSDLEVYQAAPAALYEKAQAPGAVMHSAKDAQDLLQGLSAQDKLHAPQPEQRANAAAKEAAKEATPAAEMSMGT
jgi:hypothetical protein